MVIRERLSSLRRSNPDAKVSVLAKQMGISRQRAHQLLRKMGLPTKRTPGTCAFCGKPVPRGRKFCNRSCFRGSMSIFVSKRLVPVVCANCGKRYELNLTQYTRKVKRNPMGLFFCSNKCKGQYLGRHSGWGKNRLIGKGELK